MQQPITSIKSPGYQRRKFARAILARHSSKPLPTSRPDAIRVVCVSDTHNKQPELPTGDILIHAGDLTENGSFDEVQAGLTWLSSQPHPFKFLIAGNHDVLLDEAFLQKHPERRYGSFKTKEDLDWGDPWTPRYGISAFQYPPSTGETHWRHHLQLHRHRPHNGNPRPPKLYLDRRDIHQAGCPHLLSCISHFRPRLHVFGHIHVAPGRQDVVLDHVRQAHDQVQIGWGGWDTLVVMALLVLWAKVKRVLVRSNLKERTTTFVNASAVRGRNNDMVHEPIVVEI
ncbi:Metallo-dependent phosphatase [Parathielavia appendiculata]|uniref:Metallo-dependent phosphatase n=1 Tax=Parathielavia appendiculata TaxID=2587402 RepID=A0AAN6TZE0_9PEZI|nr:Metallo-dependent phosphatase [Parathielavia appendiculata]